jgi:hypothetical protein
VSTITCRDIKKGMPTLHRHRPHCEATRVPRSQLAEHFGTPAECGPVHIQAAGVVLGGCDLYESDRAVDRNRSGVSRHRIAVAHLSQGTPAPTPGSTVEVEKTGVVVSGNDLTL